MLKNSAQCGIYSARGSHHRVSFKVQAYTCARARTPEEIDFCLHQEPADPYPSAMITLMMEMSPANPSFSLSWELELCSVTAFQKNYKARAEGLNWQICFRKRDSRLPQ